MNKPIIVIFFICISAVSYTQPRVALKAIADELDSYKNYQSICEYTFSFPFGDPMTFEATITTQKEPGDTLCGFYYCFDSTVKLTEEFGDFSNYFNNAVYNSYKGEVKKISLFDKPEAFKDLKIGIGVKPAVQRSPLLYYITPYQLAKDIGKILDDDHSIISQMPDTLINQDKCLRFILESESETTPFESPDAEPVIIKKTFELCFQKSHHYLIYYRKDAKSSFINSFDIAYFSNIKVNFPLRADYFSEENLLPQDWAKKNKPAEIKNPGNLVGKAAPDWNLPVLGKNEMLSSKSLLGKYVLLEFTATWCAHCIHAADMMNHLEDRFKDSKNVAILSLFSSNIDNKESILKFVDKFKLQSTILYSAGQVGEQYYIFNYPNFVIISPKGKVLMNFQGYNETLEKNIVNVLSELAE